MPQLPSSVTIKFIPHNQQRYDTAGDWLWDGDQLLIFVSQMPPKSAMAVAVHELVEAFLCNDAGVSAQAVDAWDFTNPDNDDPGGDPNAPYHAQHMAAEVCEKLVVGELGLSWDEHDKIVRS